MFFTKNKILTYPCKTIIEDVLSREGSADENSFSPFEGKYSLLRQYISDRDDVDYQIKEIIDSGRKDFSAEKARPNDDGTLREESANEVSAYYTKLEDIDDEFVTKYVEQVLYGFQFDQAGVKRIRNRMQTFELWEDEEDGVVSPLDIISEEDEDFSLDDIEDAKCKLPYLLKLLHEGSIKYKGSLLSFIIAINKFADLHPGKTIKPKEICSLGVYRVNKEGEITEPFVVADNTGNIFRTVFAWALGYTDDRYYRAWQDLQHVCNVLGLDLSKEDASNYTCDVIENAVCTYIMANEEYLENYGFANTRILRALSEDKINEIAHKDETEKSMYSEVFDIQMLADQIAMSVGILQSKNESWFPDAKAVVSFLYFYNKNINSRISCSLQSYDASGYILRNSNGVPVFFKVGSVFKNEDFALLSTSGYLIRYLRIEANIVMYISVKQFISCYLGGSLCAWQYTRV